MKILFDISRKPKGYVRGNIEEENRNEEIETGRPLTCFLCIALLLCTGTWTLTVWYAARNPISKVQPFQEKLSDNDQCILLPVGLR